MSAPIGDPRTALIEVLSPGLGMSLQDLGRPQWRRFGIPVGGAMDHFSARAANRLVQNPEGVPVLEMLLQGARLRFLQDTQVALTGAMASSDTPRNRPVRMIRGQVLAFPQNQAGVWLYLAVPGGFDAGDPSRDPGSRLAGSIGQTLSPGSILHSATRPAPTASSPSQAQILDAPHDLEDFAPAPLHVWPGPQWDLFPESDRAAFFSQSWKVSAQSNRVGYRLEGDFLRTPSVSLISEPVRTGSIQVPENGQPIVIMRDGPTVGGYPKLGVLDPMAVSRLAQSRPGQAVRFVKVP